MQKERLKELWRNASKNYYISHRKSLMPYKQGPTFDESAYRKNYYQLHKEYIKYRSALWKKENRERYLASHRAYGKSYYLKNRNEILHKAKLIRKGNSL